MPAINADGNDHNCECSACAERYQKLEQARELLRGIAKATNDFKGTELGSRIDAWIDTP